MTNKEIIDETMLKFPVTLKVLKKYEDKEKRFDFGEITYIMSGQTKRIKL